jgi:hypothetical protein
MKKSILTNYLPILILMAFLIVLPLLGIAQDPPPSSPNGGIQPTGDAVPFDDNMNLVFLIAGLAFAAVVTVKQLRSKVAASK